MAKDIDELLRDVFGTGSRPMSTKPAEDYLRQTAPKKPANTAPSPRQTPARPAADSDPLGSIQRNQADLSRQIQGQMEELRRLSGELDFDAIEKEVQKDFGVAPKAEATAADEMPKEPEAQRFASILPVLEGELIGQEAFLKRLVIAFKRPYVVGWDAPQGSRGGILVCGAPNTGRHTAVRLMAREMAKNGLLKSEEIQTLDLALYPGQGEEKLFLQDLYQALLPGGIVLIEHYEQCHPAFLQQLAELFRTGKLHLASRYVMQKGHLVDAGTALTANAVGTIQAGGSYLVLISEKGEEALAGAFGAKVVDALGDVCRTGALDRESRVRIAQVRLDKLREKAEKQLGFTLKENQEVIDFFAEKYSEKAGLGPLLREEESCFRALAQYKLEQDAPAQEVELTARDGALFARLDGEDRAVNSLLPGSYQGEMAAVRAEMDKIVGLTEIKNYVLSLEDNFKVQRMRREQGMKTGSVSMHMIFTGNPGTGKTTIARLVSKYLKAIGVLSGGQLVEVTRGDLVGKYVGHTAPLTMQVIKSAIGGVLFIDEAYSLYRGPDDSFGLEAIDTLVKGMEDNREDLVVILAGYTREMEVFLTANSGLKSRFPNIIEFPDYTGDELLRIAELTAGGKGYVLDEEAKSALLDYFCVIQAMESRDSGNGRLARNVIESAILAQAKRVLREEGARLDLLKREDFDLFETPEDNA